MKKGLLIFAILPLFLFAQKKLPLIQSITSDTLYGKYQQISFIYDRFDRVTDIIKTNCKTTKTSPNDVFPLIDTVTIQQFNYVGKSKSPISRKITNYEFDPVDQVSYWTFIQKQVFIYKEGKHIQDSITNKVNRLRLEEDHIDNDKPYYWKGRLEYSNKALKYILNTNYLTRRKYDYAQGETTELLINSQQNIAKEAEEPFMKSHSSSNPPYFTYSKFDKAINPLGYLNISSIFPHENISFSYDTDGLIGIEDQEIFNNDYSVFKWYYLNQNNILTYTITRGDTDSPFKDIIHLSYTYNQFNLPIECIALIHKEFTRDGRAVGKYEKRFTFSYRN
ncbi:MAG: hypothetical protein CUR34_01535 [Sediminibacterium sp.]|nr:MAG: hypothetical protein CUR34_01535 [Sediminibacterium sp.] [Sediminibacterium sp. FEMGT703S]